MTEYTEEMMDLLNAPLDMAQTEVKKVAGRGDATYIQSPAAIDNANRIFGFDGWSYRIIMGPHLEEKTLTNNQGNEQTARFYTAMVEVEALGVRRMDVGTCQLAGLSADGHDTALKGCVTDALKRVLRSFGNQFGNALYYKDAPAPDKPPRQPRASKPAPKKPKADPDTGEIQDTPKKPPKPNPRPSSQSNPQLMVRCLKSIEEKTGITDPHRVMQMGGIEDWAELGTDNQKWRDFHNEVMLSWQTHTEPERDLDRAGLTSAGQG